jgi:hypothetical protein
MKRTILSLGFCAALVCVGGASRADDGDAKQRSEALLAKGRELMAASGKLDEACATLEQSQALMNRGDTLLNLAECHRRQGRTATAWKEFGKAIEFAQDAHFADAVRVAKERHAALEAKLSFLKIVVPPEAGALPGFEVTLNGYPVPKDAWGQAVPVDPGTFAIAAKAEGRQPFSAQSQVGPDGDKREVTVALAPAPATAPTAPVPVPAPGPPPPSNANAYVTLGIAGAGLVAGIGFAVAAARAASDSKAGYGVASGLSFGVAVFGGASGAFELVQNRKRAEAAAGTARLAPRAFLAPLAVPRGGGVAGGLTF